MNWSTQKNLKTLIFQSNVITKVLSMTKIRPSFINPKTFKNCSLKWCCCFNVILLIEKEIRMKFWVMHVHINPGNIPFGSHFSWSIVQDQRFSRRILIESWNSISDLTLPREECLFSCVSWFVLQLKRTEWWGRFGPFVYKRTVQEFLSHLYFSLCGLSPTFWCPNKYKYVIDKKSWLPNELK